MFYVFERVFGDSVVMTAINRNQSSGYQLENLMSSLPNGTYYDVLGNLLGGGNITVTNGSVSDYISEQANARYGNIRRTMKVLRYRQYQSEDEQTW